ncbi:MAG: glutamyl-tRNA reductase [bacterium]|nr:glutamyl-tRNA reductase [bacterium]MCP5070690.1 glutamyl-tRNA reductase [bacterium]
MNLLLLGMSHRTASLDLRERYAVGDLGPANEKLAADPDIEECVILSTCNRVEVLVLTRRPAAARVRLRSFVERELPSAEGRPSPAELEPALYELSDADAARHVFRVACSVDSMIVGEPQILGQVKDAYRAAVATGSCGPILSRLYQRAFSTAKRVRNETRIGERSISVARVAVDLAKEIFESLEDKTALLIGAGEMIELALERLRSSGLRRARIANRTPARAAALATRFEASAHGLAELPELLEQADVVLTSIGGDGPLLTPEVVTEALRHRRHRPLFMIDIGVPRNVAPEVNQIDAVYLYDLDDLSGMAEANAGERRREVVRAEEIVLEEEQRFEGWLTALAAVPTIRTLRARAEAIRTAELERGMAALDWSGAHRDAIEGITRGIINKLLHAPLARLRQEVDREEGLAHLEAARVLFALDDARAPGAEADQGDEDE